MELWTVGYGAWPAANRAERLVGALSGRGVNLVVDVRLNPSGSDVDPSRPYGPRPWSLQPGRGGIVALLNDAGIAYEWAVELGNPQRKDRAMAILRHHLADPGGDWPVQRGLARLASRIATPGAVVALLCACDDGRACHRAVIARAVSDRHFGGTLIAREVRAGRQSNQA